MPQWDGTLSVRDYITTPIEHQAEVLIAEHRSQHGLAPMARSLGLTALACWKARDMANQRDQSVQNGTPMPFGHEDSLGRSTWERWAAFEFTPNAWKGEDIGYFAQTALTIVQGWKDSPPHNAVLLGEHYRWYGIAQAFSLDGYGFWCLCVSSADDETYVVPFQGELLRFTPGQDPQVVTA